MVLALASAVPLTYSVVSFAASRSDGEFSGLASLGPSIAFLAGSMVTAIAIPLWVHGQYRLTAVRNEQKRLLIVPAVGFTHEGGWISAVLRF